jgi:hypothetical protein
MGDLDSARREFDDEEHAKPGQPATRPDVDGEKVCGGEDAPMSLQEFGPRCLSHALGRWLQAVFAEDGGDRTAGDFVLC